jgi:hypothetical protein
MASQLYIPLFEVGRISSINMDITKIFVLGNSVAVTLLCKLPNALPRGLIQRLERRFIQDRVWDISRSSTSIGLLTSIAHV